MADIASTCVISEQLNAILSFGRNVVIVFAINSESLFQAGKQFMANSEACWRFCSDRILQNK